MTLLSKGTYVRETDGCRFISKQMLSQHAKIFDQNKEIRLPLQTNSDYL